MLLIDLKSDHLLGETLDFGLDDRVPQSGGEGCKGGGVEDFLLRLVEDSLLRLVGELEGSHQRLDNWSLEAQHFATSRRRRFPIALGRMPPSFFFAALSRAPARNGATSVGTSPFTMTLTRRVRDWRALTLLPGAAWRVALMCSGLRPEGPGAEPRLNLLTALSTSAWEKVSWGTSVLGRGPG